MEPLKGSLKVSIRVCYVWGSSLDYGTLKEPFRKKHNFPPVAAARFARSAAGGVRPPGAAGGAEPSVAKSIFLHQGALGLLTDLWLVGNGGMGYSYYKI